MMKKNEIYFNKRKAIIIPDVITDEEIINNRVVATMLKNLEYYGFTLSNELINGIKKLSMLKVEAVYNELIEIIKSSVGYKAKMKPLYANFPMDVMDKSEAELYLDAVVYYLSSFETIPESEKVTRYPLMQRVDLKVIKLGTEEDFKSIFTNLMQSKSSISENDKDIVRYFIESYEEEVLKLLPNEIPFKENLAYVTMACMSLKDSVDYLAPKYKTATDVLRLATAMSNGDISLATNTKFRSFMRAERRFLLELLENANNLKEDMLRHKNKWIKLGEKLHPSEYKAFRKANEAFHAIRNNVKITTFNSLVEEKFKNNNIEEVVKALIKRPGEFARKLDRILRNCQNENDTNLVLTSFEGIADKVETPLLLQLREFYFNRNTQLENRVFFPKGSMAKAYTIPNNIKEIEEDICKKVSAICTETLLKVYSNREEMGKVYIDEDLKSYIVPTSLRNSSRAVRTIARGSKMNLSDTTNIIRLFLYWKEPESNETDLDLGAVFYDEDFKRVSEVYFGNLKETKYGAVHSGDVRKAPNGATEFIDLNLDKLKDNGIRYVVGSVNSFTSQQFVELPECFVGFMERDNDNFGEIFEPKTVSHKADLTSPTGVCIPMVIDVFERKAIWVDLSGQASELSNVGQGVEKNRLLSSLKAILNVCKPNVYDMAMLNAMARGEVVNDKEDADIIFSLTEGITPFDTDIILAQYI